MTELQTTEISVNGVVCSLTVGETVRNVVAVQLGRAIATDGTAEDGGRLGVAVALNSAVVPRSRWATTALAPHDAIEIVTAAQGG